MLFFTTTSRELRARPRRLQVLALFFVVLYILASVRGLVPGLCLNLVAPDALASYIAESDCVQTDAGSCCAKVESDETGSPDGTPKAPKRCPFCRLALGLSETPIYVHFEALATSAFRPHYAAPTSEVPTRFDVTVSGRAPPASLPA